MGLLDPPRGTENDLQLAVKRGNHQRVPVSGLAPGGDALSASLSSRRTSWPC
jgi:hypothetical protein